MEDENVVVICSFGVGEASVAEVADVGICAWAGHMADGTLFSAGAEWIVEADGDE